MSVKITDEMVERFHDAYKRNDWPVFDSVASRIKEGLEAALNPPAEPEIPVSEGMSKAGQKAIAALETNIDSRSLLYTIKFADMATVAYRAMEAQRRKEAAESKQRWEAR